MAMDHVYDSFGQWLQQRRTALHLTQQQLGRLVGCSESMVRKLEADERRPSPEVVTLLMGALQIPAAEHAAFRRFARGDAPDLPAVPLASHTLPPSGLGHRPLPAPLTALLGREQECAGLRDLLAPGVVRLVTLTGVGGVGKTRLAIQVAQELATTYADGAAFVDLTPIRDPAFVAAAIAASLRVREAAGESLEEALSAFLARRHLLLVLDNVEQVVTAALLLDRLLQAAPRLTLLVTSRVPLGVYGEHLVEVLPLELPLLASTPADPQAYMDRLVGNAAVQLFVARARAVEATFALTPENAPAIAAICHQLDGLPLAIELAAHRVRVLPPQALLRRLRPEGTGRFAVLVGGAQTAPARQRTLRDTIGWSYELLAPVEQTLFARLAVFAGGCSLEATESICGDTDGMVADGLVSLVEKSLVRQQEGADGEPRFMMLESIREYALERLEASGETASLRERHAHYYVDWVVALVEQYSLGQRGKMIDTISPELSNLVATVQWITNEGEVEAAVRWHAAAETSGSLLSLGSVWQAWGRLHQALMERGETVPNQARAKALHHIGRFAWFHGDFAQAAAILEESLALTRTLGDPQELQAVLSELADAYRDQDQCPRAQMLYEENLALYLDGGHHDIPWWYYHAMAGIALLRQDYDRAFMMAQASLTLFRATGTDWGISSALLYSGFAAYHQGDEHAMEYFLEGLRVAQLYQMPVFIRESLIGFAAVAVGQRQPERAARLLGTVEALEEVSLMRLFHVERREYERTIKAAHAQLDEPGWSAAWQEGRAMTLEQAIAYVLDETNPE